VNGSPARFSTLLCIAWERSFAFPVIAVPEGP
jgi:hypothetical protein